MVTNAGNNVQRRNANWSALTHTDRNGIHKLTNLSVPVTLENSISTSSDEEINRLTTPTPDPHIQRPDADPVVMDPDLTITMGFRSIILLAAGAIYVWSDMLQGYVNSAWQYLSDAWWFRSVYFETVWTTVTYAYIMLVPFVMHYITCFDCYKVDKNVTFVPQTVVMMLLEAVVYIAPLACLDTILVKKYCGVHPQEWDLKQRDWIQTTRALPLDPPTVLQIVYQVIGGVIIFDAIFFVIHLTLHKYRPLYTLLHQYHHDHSIMHVHVTNQLSVGERIMLVLSANQALKILYSHPLSRALFVPVFVGLLVDNHTGYDLPWGLQHLLPKGMWGGPRLHHAHHILGTRHYQPFLTYLDHALLWWQGQRPVHSSITAPK